MYHSATTSGKRLIERKCCKSITNSDFNKELGLGFIVYFVLNTPTLLSHVTSCLIHWLPIGGNSGNIYYRPKLHSSRDSVLFCHVYRNSLFAKYPFLNWVRLVHGVLHRFFPFQEWWKTARIVACSKYYTILENVFVLTGRTLMNRLL